MDSLRLSPVQEEYSPPTENYINSIIEEVGHPLPDQYERFFRSYGGQAPDGYVYFGFSTSHLVKKKGVVDIFFGMIPGDPYDILWNFRTYRGRIPYEFLPIASDPGGNLICISLQGEYVGSIYFWDHNHEENVVGNEEPSYSNIYLIASSFEEFVGSLEVVSDEEE